MSNQPWTDERIADELGAIAIENFDHFVILRMATTVGPLMRQMRDELAATERADTMTMKAAWIDTAGDYGALLEKHETLLAWAKQAYKAMQLASQDSWCVEELLDAPEEVQP